MCKRFRQWRQLDDNYQCSDVAFTDNLDEVPLNDFDMYLEARPVSPEMEMLMEVEESHIAGGTERLPAVPATTDVVDDDISKKVMDHNKHNHCETEEEHNSMLTKLTAVVQVLRNFSDSTVTGSTSSKVQLSSAPASTATASTDPAVKTAVATGEKFIGNAQSAENVKSTEILKPEKKNRGRPSKHQLSTNTEQHQPDGVTSKRSRSLKQTAEDKVASGSVGFSNIQKKLKLSNEVKNDLLNHVAAFKATNTGKSHKKKCTNPREELACLEIEIPKLESKLESLYKKKKVLESSLQKRSVLDSLKGKEFTDFDESEDESKTSCPPRCVIVEAFYDESWEDYLVDYVKVGDEQVDENMNQALLSDVLELGKKENWAKEGFDEALLAALNDQKSSDNVQEIKTKSKRGRKRVKSDEPPKIVTIKDVDNDDFDGNDDDDVEFSPFVFSFLPKSRSVKLLTLDNYQSVRYIVRNADYVGGPPDTEHEYSELISNPEKRPMLETFLKKQGIRIPPDEVSL
jgi:hypothetical protein